MNLLTFVLTIYVASHFPYHTYINTCTVIVGSEVVTVDTEDFCHSECDAGYYGRHLLIFWCNYGVHLHCRRM